MDSKPQQSPLDVMGKTRGGRGVLNLVGVHGSVCAEESTQNEGKNLVRAAEDVRWKELLRRSEVELETPDQGHDGIGLATPPSAGDSVSISVLSPWTNLENRIQTSDRALQHLEDSYVGVGESDHTTRQPAIAQQETQENGLILREFVRSRRFRQPSDGGDPIAPPQVPDGFPLGVRVQEMVACEAQFSATSKPKGLDGRPPVHDSLLLLDDRLSLFVKRDYGGAEGFDGLQICILLDNSGAATDALAEPALPRQAD